MRRDNWIIASIAVSGIALGACGMSNDKSEKDPIPEPATAQVSQDQPVMPTAPEPPSAPEVDREQATPGERRGPVDRAGALQSTLAQMERGDFGEAFKYLAEDVVWTEVGLPDGELTSVPEIVGYEEKSRTGFSEFQIKARRIIESADYQVVEFVWSARHTGAFADGTAATNKVAVVPGAMLLRYQKNGLINRVWVFQDWPNALQQLGLAQGLPADFKTVAFPTHTEIVIGRYEPLFREKYEGFVDKLGPRDYRATLGDHTAADFAWSDLDSGQLVSTHDGTNTYFAQRRGSFERDGFAIETAIGAGPFFAAYVTNNLVYKGGFMGVPADNQKITTHTLDIVSFELETLRFKTLASYGNSYEILAALGVSAGAAARPEAKAGRFAIEACDDYVEHMRACLQSLPVANQEATRERLDQQIVRWQTDHKDGGSRDDVKRSCDAATAAAKTEYASACPRVEWE